MFHMRIDDYMLVKIKLSTNTVNVKQCSQFYNIHVLHTQAGTRKEGKRSVYSEITVKENYSMIN